MVAVVRGVKDHQWRQKQEQREKKSENGVNDKAVIFL